MYYNKKCKDETRERKMEADVIKLSSYCSKKKKKMPRAKEFSKACETF